LASLYLLKFLDTNPNLPGHIYRLYNLELPSKPNGRLNGCDLSNFTKHGTPDTVEPTILQISLRFLQPGQRQRRRKTEVNRHQSDAGRWR